MISKSSDNLNCVVTLLTEVARLAIHDYKRYAEKYNRLLAELPDGATKECRLFRIKRSTERIERFFIEDYYGVFNERGKAYIEKLRLECGYSPRDRISYNQYCLLLPQEAVEEKKKPKGIQRVVTINKRKVE